MSASTRYEEQYAATAVQLRFVTRQQLEFAASDADDDGDANLAERLVRHRLITEAEANAIAAVTDQQLAREMNPAADTPHATRHADPAQTLATPHGSHETGANADSFATHAFTPTRAIGEFTRFTVLRPHAKGGLGQVLIARDSQLNREIALKEILPTHADDAVSRQRFLREAEITGALEHPGIVPIYSLGEYPDGRPFYAMRFILGDDLRAAIERLHAAPPKGSHRDFEIRQLLGRFIDVCQAVDYAHNRGVIHRDIKPENIMLGDYGETLVVDWGLARPLDQQEEAPSTLQRVALSPRTTPSHTQAGHVVGTPTYMSPEQAEGRLDLIGPASDVYSLGATLYHMLTGRPPFAGDSDDVIGSVQRGQFKLPRTANPRVARPLEAVCLQAMAARPSDRYATARDLGLDVERYLSDEKVLAYDEPLWMRTWRWVRNHRTPVLSLMAAATVALAALTIGIALLGAANQRERAAREEATRNYLESVKQRDRAEQNFGLAQDAVRNYYIQISEETLLSQPGMQPLRNALLQQALAYYQQFLDQRSDDPGLQSELAQAAYFVGKITETIASPELALPHFQQAIDLYRQLGRDPSPADDRPLQAEYARALNAMGGAHQKLRQHGEALGFYEQALDLRERRAAADPDDHEAARELSNTLMNVGALALRQGDPDAAIRQMKHAQTIRLAHVSETATPPKLQRDLAIGYFNLAAAQLAASQISGVPPTGDQMEETQRNLVNAAEAFAKLGEDEPLSVDHQRRLAIAHRLLGDLAGEQGRDAEAIEYYQRSGAALRDLVENNPSVPAFAVDLAGVSMNLGAQYSKNGNFANALRELRNAAELLAKLAEAPESPPRYRRDLAAARRAAGQVLLSLGRRAEALADLSASRETLRALVREFPNDQDFAAQLQLTLAAIEATDDAPGEKSDDPN